jgi:pimeloyl-ACP methyl ester carboxylesterase
MKSFTRVVAAAVLTATALFAASATTSAKNADWFVDESKLPFDPLPGAEAYWGVRSGAGYQMEVPENWNGDLVLYAHGFRGDGLELTVDAPPTRQHLIDEGYAWAASSYRKNGYAPATGAKDTRALIAEFTGRVDNPDQVFVTGFSMGGHVIGHAIEQWPNSFDGAVPMCGVMGDSDLFDYFQDSYLLAEQLANGSVEVPTPDDYYTSGAWAATLASLGLFGPGLTPDGQKYKDAIEQLTGGERPIYDEGFVGPNGGLFPFFFQQATTDNGRQNVDTVYQFDNDPALSPEEVDLNEIMPRIDAAPQFRKPNGTGKAPGSEAESPKINGTISMPVVSLHTIGELFVPFHMQQIYAERVAANGNSDLLVQRAIRDVNHCGFSLTEMIQAFDDMVDWVETGVRPAGDDVLDRAAVADPAFGCAHTVNDFSSPPNRAGLPACP